MDDEGKVIKQGKFSNDPRSLGEFLDGINVATVVMEVGYCWQSIYEWVESEGHDMKLANPLKTKLIAEVKVKTDKIDSEVLAHLLASLVGNANISYTYISSYFLFLININIK